LPRSNQFDLKNLKEEKYKKKAIPKWAQTQSMPICTNLFVFSPVVDRSPTTHFISALQKQREPKNLTLVLVIF
jgi:hypothetical protein